MYSVVEQDTVGFSPGAALKDENGREWSVKQGPEAHTEVVISRILSAVGYHQPPVYYVEQWTQRGGVGPREQRAGRFRPKDIGLKDKGPWSWQENPFVGTPAYRGLLALMMLLNGTDLKNDNNTLYEVSASLRDAPRGARRRGVSTWYVVRDVGAALGETGKLDPSSGDPFLFAKTPFITGVRDGFVRFDYRGHHQELIEQITPADVRWMVRLMSRLSDRQWRDAFRAGGYGPGASEMFITRIKEKLTEALTLCSAWQVGCQRETEP